MTNLKTLLTLLVFVFTSAQAFGSTLDKEKIVLPYLDIKDSAIEFAAFDVNSLILRKSKGFLWPVTKITFSKNGDKLFFDVMAIDNSWSNLFDTSEKPYGYFVVNNRMFIVSTKGSDTVDLDQYFIRDYDIPKTFYKDESNSKPKAKNPIWWYLYKKEMALVLKSANLENLGR